MNTGTIKFFNVTKGFGFISQENGGGDVFVHVSKLSEGTNPADLTEGKAVSFEVIDGRKGPEASNVQLA